MEGKRKESKYAKVIIAFTHKERR